MCRMTRWNAVLAAITSVLVVVFVVKTARDEDRRQFLAPARVPAGAVAGIWDQYCIHHRTDTLAHEILWHPGRFDGCADKEVGRHIEADEVWCRWVGANVFVHLRLRNTAGEAALVEVTPRYFADDIQHGAFQGSSSMVTLAAYEMTTVDLAAGSPEGTPDGARISDCVPRQEDAHVASQPRPWA